MSNQQPLWRTLYFQPLYRRLAKAVGYIGFPSRELYDRLHTIADEFDAKPLAQALTDLVSLDGHRVCLTPEARRLCWQLLGPPSEAWDTFYRDAEGKPQKRPKGRDSPPPALEPIADPLMDSVKPPITNNQLLDRLQKARHDRAEHDPKSPAGALAQETIVCIQCELLRRGLPIPADDIPVKKPPRKRRKKQPAKKS